jgi:hypothetical protein
MPDSLDIKIDASGLNAGIVEASVYSKRSLAEICNTCGYWIAVNAKAKTPFVTADKVDQQLHIIKTSEQQISVRTGKTLKKTITRYSSSSAASGKVAVTTGGKTRAVPFAALIVAARAKQDSKYNASTNSRYALAKNPFKGLTRGLGRQKMAALVESMTNSRHSSGSFLKSSLVPIVQALESFTKQKFSKGGSSPNEAQRQYYNTGLGRASPASDGWSCSCELLDELGMQGVNSASHNKALTTILGPIFTSTVQHEGEVQAKYALDHYEKELSDRVNKFLS